MPTIKFQDLNFIRVVTRMWLDTESKLKTEYLRLNRVEHQVTGAPLMPITLVRMPPKKVVVGKYLITLLGVPYFSYMLLNLQIGEVRL